MLTSVEEETEVCANQTVRQGLSGFSLYTLHVLLDFFGQRVGDANVLQHVRLRRVDLDYLAPLRCELAVSVQ